MMTSTPLGLYRDTGPVTGLHLCNVNSISLHLQLLRLGCLPDKQHTNQNGNIISCGLYRDTRAVTGLHLCGADLHVYLQFVGCVPV